MSKYMEKLSLRVAVEAQLLCEEKWLIETLTAIKKQRNCLQIERLHLESLRLGLEQMDGKNSNTDNRPLSPTSIQETSQRANDAAAQAKVMGNDVQYKMNMFAEAACNFEELDLDVSRSVFNDHLDTDYNIEEDEQEEDCDDMVIDMNMLMNGRQEPQDREH